MTDQELIDAYLEGLPLKDIACTALVHYHDIVQRLKALGILMPPGRSSKNSRIVAVLIEEVVARHALGESCASLGKAYGVSRATISTYLGLRGIETKSYPKRLSAEDRETRDHLIRQVHKFTGAREEDIGTVFSLSDSSVRKIVKEQVDASSDTLHVSIGGVLYPLDAVPDDVLDSLPDDAAVEVVTVSGEAGHVNFQNVVDSGTISSSR
jgi:hypothetical protein